MGMKIAKFSFGAEVEILKDLVMEGRISQEHLDSILRRTNGDVDRFFEDPEAITLFERFLVFGAAYEADSESDGQVAEQDDWADPLPGATLAIPERRDPRHATGASRPDPGPKSSALRIAIRQRVREIVWLVFRSFIIRQIGVSPEDKQYVVDVLGLLLNELEGTRRAGEVSGGFSQ